MAKEPSLNALKKRIPHEKNKQMVKNPGSNNVMAVKQ